MNKETVNQEATITSTNGNTFISTAEATVNDAIAEKKVFTQEELDQMIGDRLARERAKYADYESLKEKAEKFDQIEEESKTELQKMTEKADSLQAKLDEMQKAEEVRAIREEVSSLTNVPANLLTGETKEDCEAQAKAILSFAKPDGYPAVKDGGEVTKQPTGTAKEQFTEWWLENQNN